MPQLCLKEAGFGLPDLEKLPEAIASGFVSNHFLITAEYGSE
jgi:hypothetical protein